MMLKKIIILLFFIFFTCSFSLAEDLIISGIEVEGNKTADKSLILLSSGINSGSFLDLSTVQRAIRRIYALNLFSNVSIYANQKLEGIVLTIKVEELPLLTQLEIKGNKKFKQEEIEEKLNFKIGALLSPYQVKEGINIINALYKDKGYLATRVQSELKPGLKEGETILIYNIDEGKKVKIKKIYVEGTKDFPAGKIKKQMKNKEDNWIRSGEFNSDKYRDDKDRIVEFYRKEGYLDAEILNDSIWFDPSGRDMYIRISLSEGERYKFGEIDFEGNSVYTNENLKKVLKFKEGEFYNQKKCDETLTEIYNLYQEEGYIYVQLKDLTSTQGNVVNINYQITEGVPANIHFVNIEGNTKTKEKVIRRELSIIPGQRFHRSILMRSLRDIMYLNYFSNVIPDFEVLPSGDIDLVIKVEEKPTGSINFGAGYSQRDKIVGSIGLGIPNLFGNGQNINLNWEFGKTRNSVQVSFTEPWFRGTPTSVGIDLYQLNSKWYDDYTEGRTGVGLRVGRRLSWPDNYFRVYTRYRLESIRYFDFSDSYLDTYKDSPYNLNNIDWPQSTSSIDFTIMRDSRDLPQFATSGSVAYWNSELAGGLLGGNWSYHKHIFEFSKYIKTFWKFVLLTKAKFGIIDGYSRNSIIPYSERFSPGGTDPDGMVRGYPDGWIGSRDEEGNLIRGRSILIYNLEYQYPIVSQQIYGLFFADAGNAWLAGRKVSPLSLRHFYKSVGFGFRMIVPNLGMIGFDFGYGFDYPGDNKWRPHFQFGRSF
ncbi:MAG: outer membrane protein assembly factor BamA [candidate division Zixibacteria bacterium]|nr:outer membrane protein assembly factor BamA [candidate division Zixibacteria bacterium]